MHVSGRQAPLTRTLAGTRGRRMRSTRGTAALLLLAFCALLGAAGPLVVYFSTEPREAHRWVDHSYAIIDRLQNLIAAIADAETGQRGYLLTHNTAYLE